MKKKRAQEKLPTKEPVTIKPIASPTLTKVPDKVSTSGTETQLTAKPTVDTSQQLTPTTTSLKPTLAATPTVGQVPVVKQIPEVQQKPQLPPAQSQIKESKSEVPTALPIVETSAPATLQETKKEQNSQNL
jgi:hypothetical protein